MKWWKANLNWFTQTYIQKKTKKLTKWWETDLMCLTQLDPTLSATNSTVRLRDGGWLWKKACSRSTYGKTHGKPWTATHQRHALNSFTDRRHFAGSVPEVFAVNGWWKVPSVLQTWGWSCELSLHSWMYYQPQKQQEVYETPLPKKLRKDTSIILEFISSEA